MSKLGGAIIQIDEDRSVDLLFSNRAIAEAEQILGKGILEVLNDFQNNKGGIRDAAVLLQAGMEAHRRYSRSGGRRVTLNDAYDLLDDVGFAVAAAPIFQAVAEVLSRDRSGDDEEGEESPN